MGILNGEVVCHTGIIFFPMRKGKKRVHRLVVLPDYQGIGIGTRFIKEVAKIVEAEGYELNLTTTTPALVGALRHDPEWILARYGRSDDSSGWARYVDNGRQSKKHLGNASSSRRITYSFWHKERR